MVAVDGDPVVAGAVAIRIAVWRKFAARLPIVSSGVFAPAIRR